MCFTYVQIKLLEYRWIGYHCFVLCFLFLSGTRQAKSDSKQSSPVFTGVLTQLLSFMTSQIRYNNCLTCNISAPLIFLFLLLFLQSLFSAENLDFSYFIFKIALQIPGVGEGEGEGALPYMGKLSGETER